MTDVQDILNKDYAVALRREEAAPAFDLENHIRKPIQDVAQFLQQANIGNGFYFQKGEIRKRVTPWSGCFSLHRRVRDGELRDAFENALNQSTRVFDAAIRTLNEHSERVEIILEERTQHMDAFAGRATECYEAYLNARRAFDEAREDEKKLKAFVDSVERIVMNEDLENTDLPRMEADYQAARRRIRSLPERRKVILQTQQATLGQKRYIDDALQQQELDTVQVIALGNGARLFADGLETVKERTRIDHLAYISAYEVVRGLEHAASAKTGMRFADSMTRYAQSLLSHATAPAMPFPVHEIEYSK